MLVRERFDEFLAKGPVLDADGLQVRLPDRLGRDRCDVRTAMFIRLAASRNFALGDRAGALRAAQNRSGRAFRLDVRQRVIVKAMVSRHLGKGAARATALAAHVVYLGRQGAGVEGERAEFFDREADGLDARAVAQDWGRDRHHFRLIISPENGERIRDLRDYVRDVMGRVGADLGEPGLTWIATCHYDTDQPHAHVLLRGRRSDGRDLVIPRGYIGYGLRARAQEAAQERLGDLSRLEAERRVWKEAQADRFTALDRRLLAAADEKGFVDDGVGGADAWSALTRGRLRILEALGLATREGRQFRLHEDMEARLRDLEVRQDVIRTLNQRRMESGRVAQVARPGRLSGEVVKAGSHDELGMRRFVIVRDGQGVEKYTRLSVGAGAMALGQHVVLEVGTAGLAQIVQGRGGGAGLG
ncbi:type VI secretion protein [Brevundimonas diminuta]|uniref:type VI secretion protein n=1 Tax=Brevundimonas diminuta TaxID=293 RepID=UPI0037CC77C3